ncbi:hypothetical protein GF327_04000 [Candidatus Woesearchaeota archaeon]|nr:hypothetical protein [Candidatus Woesearchaeota archaeon]
MLEKNTRIKKNVLERIFGKGYGGNRNFALALTLNNKVLSVDDDVELYSFRPSFPLEDLSIPEFGARGGPEMLAAQVKAREFQEVAHGYTAAILPENGKKLSFDLEKLIKAYLGKTVGELSCKKAKENLVRGLDPSYRFGQLYVSGMPPGPASWIATVFFPVSYASDMDEYVGEEGPEVLAHDCLKPVALQLANIGCTCYCADNSSYGKIPFIPTDLKLEDFVHQYMMFGLDAGSSVIVDQDIMHLSHTETRKNKKKIQKRNLAAAMIRGFVKVGVEEMNCDTLSSLAGYLKKVNKTDMTKLAEKLIKHAEKNQQENFSLERRHINSLTGLVNRELKNAIEVFENWQDIREFLLENPFEIAELSDSYK